MVLLVEGVGRRVGLVDQVDVFTSVYFQLLLLRCLSGHLLLVGVHFFISFDLLLFNTIFATHFIYLIINKLD